MSRRRKDPLRPLTEDERRHLTRLSRATALPAVHVARRRPRAAYRVSQAAMSESVDTMHRLPNFYLYRPQLSSC